MRGNRQVRWADGLNLLLTLLLVTALCGLRGVLSWPMAHALGPRRRNRADLGRPGAARALRLLPRRT